MRGQLSARAGLLRPGPAPLRIFWLLGFAVFFAWFSYRIGGDGTPDFRGYHFYNGFAAVSGGRPGDIAAAQLQTYFFPALDAAYYLAFRGLDAHPRLLRALLGLPYAVASWAVFRVGERVLPPSWPVRTPLAAVLALFGVTGAAGFATIGTTMSEIVPGLPALVAIPFWLARRDAGQPGLGAVAAGALCGLSLGLKLTFAPFFAGVLVAIFLCELPRLRAASWLAFLFLVTGVVVTLAVAGWWWAHNYATLGNPIFPAFNDVFRSDLADHGRWSDDRFKPRDWLMALFYPAYWAFRPSHFAIELDMRDPRMLIGLVSAIMVLLAIGLRRPRRASDYAAAFVATVVLVAYGLWEFQFSIYRYLAVPECFSGVLAAAALALWVPPRLPLTRAAAAFLVVLAVVAARWTKYPWWVRSSPSSHVVEVSVPAMEPDSMVILLDDYQMSFVVPFLQPSVRVIGAHTNLVRPGSEGLLSRQIASAIRSHPGPIWGLEDHTDLPDVADATLVYHGLKRTGHCEPIHTNVERDRIIACLLARDP